MVIKNEKQNKEWDFPIPYYNFIKMAKVYLPPQNITFRNRFKKSVFLAGSIEMGKAEDWQATLSEWLLIEDFNVFNPRRKDWDSSWIQTFTNPNFAQQVRWELNSLDKSDIIIMYLDPNTISPISLLELGLYAHTGKLLVVCPDGFFRKGNVEVVCDIHDIPLFNTIGELTASNHFDDNRRDFIYRVKFFFNRIRKSFSKIRI